MIFELRGDDRDGTKAVASSEYRERGVRNDSVVYGISERQGKERGTFSGGRFRGGRKNRDLRQDHKFTERQAEVDEE